MTTCKECASEISETEAFCPFCGIKIESAVEPPPVAEIIAADPEFDSTIVITPGEVAAMKEQIAAPAESTPPPSPFDPPPPASFHRTAPTLEDIPAPSILSDGFARPTDPGINLGADATPTKESPVFDEEVIPEPVAEVPDFVPAAEVQPELAPSNSQAFESAEPAQKVEAPLFEGPAAPVVEETAPSIAEVEEVRPPTFDLAPKPESTLGELESTVDEGNEPAQDLAVFEPVAESHSSEALVSGTIPSELPGPQAFTEPQPEIAAFVPETVSEPEPVIEDTPVIEEPVSISKPLENLEEAVPEPSMFDSVRIMEGMQPSADYVDTVIPGHGFQIPPVIPTPAETAIPALSERSGDIARSTGLGDTDSRKAGKLKQLPEGTVLNGRYEVVRKIGGGGMGAVYLASDNNLGGVLRAVKEMVQAHIEDDQQEKAINDFKRESMILSTLDHPSIPTIYDYFYDAEESRFYLVMKYISGGDLASKLRSSADGKIEELIVTEWAIQLTDVLNYLHNQPSTIVYRDLKPSNIMLDGNSSRVMLIDFGIARNISQKEEKGVTAVGTMGYAPPELFSGNVEPRSDIYSLGSTMFHLLTGADPQSNPLLIFDFQKNPRPRQINSRLSDQMERILMRTVEYNAESRFSSAGELKAVLEEHLANLRSGNLTFGVTEAPVSVSLANQSVFCGFCGQRIVATDLFCAFCGAKQPIAQQGVHSEIYQKTSTTARLVIEGTSELSAPIYALQKDDNLIGRRDPMSNIFPEVDLSKYDPQTKISRRHAKVWRDGTSFMLEDLGSSNGTVVEGSANNVFKLPAHQPYKLSSGDRIKIGDTRLHFVVG
ncbi:MAG TPA: protein kinase [Pyrinomonadaceae bacterium]|nr:protein kinase [Pyrinomonadaceae bacterium]